MFATDIDCLQFFYVKKNEEVAKDSVTSVGEHTRDSNRNRTETVISEQTRTRIESKLFFRFVCFDVKKFFPGTKLLYFFVTEPQNTILFLKIPFIKFQRIKW